MTRSEESVVVVFSEPVLRKFIPALDCLTRRWSSGHGETSVEAGTLYSSLGCGVWASGPGSTGSMIHAMWQALLG